MVSPVSFVSAFSPSASGQRQAGWYSTCFVDIGFGFPACPPFTHQKEKVVAYLAYGEDVSMNNPDGRGWDLLRSMFVVSGGYWCGVQFLSGRAPWS